MPVANPSTTGLFPHLTDVGMQFNWEKLGDPTKGWWDGLFLEETQKSLTYEEATAYGFGAVKVKLQAQPLKFDSPVAGPTKSYTLVVYGSQWEVSDELEDDDLSSFIAKGAENMNKACRLSLNIILADVFNDAFAGATYTGADGLALCVNNHPNYRSGGTWSNVLAAAADPGHTALMNMRQMLLYQLSDEGFYFENKPFKYIVTPTFDSVADVVLTTDRLPGSNHWDRNILEGKAEKLTLPYLTDADCSFLTGPKSTLGLKLRWAKKRGKPYLQQEPMIETGLSRHTVKMRLAHGFTHGRNIIGTAGAP